MKKVFFLFACLSVFALSAQAQKACTKSKASCAKMKTAANAGVAVDDAVVAKAASLDEAVERRVCAKSGNVSYHMNYKCAESGNMTSKEVSYDAATAKFVNVSPSDMEMAPVKGKKACCSSSCSKACCAKKGAVKTRVEVQPVEEKSSAIKVSNGTMKQ